MGFVTCTGVPNGPLVGKKIPVDSNMITTDYM